MNKSFLVTSALPYANGPIHIGHLAGAYLPADIYVRFLKMMKEDVVYICGTDEHGTPITFQAEKRNISPQQVVDEFHHIIKNSLESADIQFDFFGRTSDKEHYKTTQEFFIELYNNGFIEEHEEEHFYCDETNQFLADRYIQGECPHCGFEKARGDECSRCGKWLEANKLKNPSSPLCPVDITKKNTKHWFLSLDKFQPQLEDWLNTKQDWKDNVVTFVKGWFKEGLKPRAITRDLSWGVPIPLEDTTTKGKVLYVWFDAPIGYLSMTQKWAKEIKKQPDLWKKYWLESENTELVHFLGKDNIPFHTIVWPAMLMGQNEKYILPSYIPANEYLNIEGEKISSSIGNAVWIEEVVEKFSSDYLRFYLATISPENKDADFSWAQFANVINTDLVNTIGNLYQRASSFIVDRFNGVIPAIINADERDKTVLLQMEQILTQVKLKYAQFQVKESLKAIMDLARLGNSYFQEYEPWKLIKTDPEKVGNISNILIRLIEVLFILLNPIIPNNSLLVLQRIRSSYNVEVTSLKNYTIIDPAGRILTKEAPLFRRIEDSEVQEQRDILKQRMEVIVQNNNMHSTENQAIEEEKPSIDIEHFSSISIQTGKIILVEAVPKSKKLLRFILETRMGERQILSGIATSYPEPEVLLGKYVAFVANLPPRKMMGLESYGMILSAANSEGVLEVVEVSEKVGSGANIK